MEEAGQAVNGDFEGLCLGALPGTASRKIFIIGILIFMMEFIKLCNDEVLADHPVGNLVIKKSGDFC